MYILVFFPVNPFTELRFRPIRTMKFPVGDGSRVEDMFQFPRAASERCCEWWQRAPWASPDLSGSTGGGAVHPVLVLLLYSTLYMSPRLASLRVITSQTKPNQTSLVQHRSVVCTLDTCGIRALPRQPPKKTW